MDYSKLNDEQLDAVQTTEGPIMILAGAGTGKTTCLTYKVAHLVEMGVEPSRILMLTFTNKAADEMTQRANKILGFDDDSKVKVSSGTYHSFCAELLRRHSEEIGFEANFTICDQADAAEIVNLVKERLNYKKEEMLPTGKQIIEMFSYCINKEKTLEFALENKYPNFIDKLEQLEKIKEQYTIYKYENNILDYDDLLIQTNNLLESDIELCKKLSNYYKYILVDEYQDSNMLQMELILKLRQFSNKNICIVGDPEQCLVEGTQVQTKYGKKNIEDIGIYDYILTCTGRGKVEYKSIEKISKHKIDEFVYTIKTKSGKEITGTKDHIVFADNIIKNKYYIYLMFNKLYGYRISYAKTVSKSNIILNPYQKLLTNEDGNCMWILDTFDNIKDAKKALEKLIMQYGITTLNYHPTARNKKTQKEIDEFYAQNDTRKIAKKIFKNEAIFERYPTYIRKHEDGNSLNQIRFTLFGDKRELILGKTNNSILSVDTVNKDFCETITKYINVPIYEKNTKNNNTRYISKLLGNSDDLVELARKALNSQDITKYDNVLYSEGAFILPDERYEYLPLAMLKPGMYVCVYDGNKIISDEITEISNKYYSGYVYDLNISRIRNFIANDICVHNCIYGFRGSRYENILSFPDQFKGCKVIKLNQNYRSNQEILNLSNCITSGTGIFENNLKGQYSCGYKPKIINVATQQDEAVYVMRKIDQYLRQGVSPNDIAILTRGSNDSSALEAKLLNIDYNKYGGIKFWERESTKNVLSYLKILNNIKDEISWFRILKLYPSIGSVNSKKITEGILLNGIDELKDSKYNKKQYKEYLEEIFDEYEYIKELDLQEKIEYVINNYYQKVMKRSINAMKIKEVDKRKKIRDLDEDIDRLQNLIESAKGYKSLNSYINDILLDSNSDNKKENAITISTIHSAKGLEWKIVFILGCIEGKFPWEKEPAALTEEAKKAVIEELEEEKRVFYVAITRCKQDLYMMYPQYNIYSKTETNLSRFLVEKDLYKTKCDLLNYL